MVANRWADVEGRKRRKEEPSDEKIQDVNVDAIVVSEGQNRHPLCGKRVRIQGLMARPELNGCIGKVDSYDARTERLGVFAKDEAGNISKLAIKAANLALAEVATDKVELLRELCEQMLGPMRDKGCSLHDLGMDLDGPGGPKSNSDWVELLMPMMEFFRKLGTEDGPRRAWRVCEVALPIAVEAHGPHSTRVASILMFQVNTYDDLDRPVQPKHSRRCVERAKALQQLAQAEPPWLRGNPVELIWWPHEGAVFSRAYLEAEAGRQMGSAHQDLGDTDAALAAYQHALARAVDGGFADHPLSGMIHNNLGALYQQLGAPMLTMTRRHPSPRTPTPQKFDDLAVRYHNDALRHSLQFLRIVQRCHGASHVLTGRAHLAVADMCYVARVRRAGVYHAGVAKKVLAGLLGPSHSCYQDAERIYRMLTSSLPAGLAVPLDDDIARGLSRSASTARCQRQGCENVEEVREEAAADSIPADHAPSSNFMSCARCLLVKYCSRECQKLDWPDHKNECKRIAPVAEEVEQERPNQRRMNREAAQIQHRMYCAQPVSIMTHPSPYGGL